MWFYVDQDRQQRGPVTVDDLQRMFTLGEINKRTHLWQEGRAEWARLEDLAQSLGIAIAQPPPTPPPTMVMQSQHAAPPAYPAPRAVQPASQPVAPSAYQPPVGQAVPAQSAPSFPAPLPPQPTPNFPPPTAPNAYANAAPAYPNVQAPVASASGGGAFKNFAFAFFGLCLVGYYGYKYLGRFVPGISDRQATAALIDAGASMAPVRAEIEKLFTEQKTCPNKDLPVKAEVESDVFTDFSYGTIGEQRNCYFQIDIPNDYPLKQIAGTSIIYVFSENTWHCGMNAEAKFIPAGCDKTEITKE